MDTEESHIPLMSSRTASHIHRLFVVTSEQALQEAHELLGLIESKGGECTNWGVMSNLIEKQLGNRLEWRHESEKLASIKDREETVASWKAYFKLGRRTEW